MKRSGSRLKAIFLQVSLLHTTAVCSFLAPLPPLMLQGLAAPAGPVRVHLLQQGTGQNWGLMPVLLLLLLLSLPPEGALPVFWDLDRSAGSEWTARSRMCVSVQETEAVRGKGIKNVRSNPICVCQTQLMRQLQAPTLTLLLCLGSKCFMSGLDPRWDHWNWERGIPQGWSNQSTSSVVSGGCSSVSVCWKGTIIGCCFTGMI